MKRKISRKKFVLTDPLKEASTQIPLLDSFGIFSHASPDYISMWLHG